MRALQKRQRHLGWMLPLRLQSQNTALPPTSKLSRQKSLKKILHGLFNKSKNLSFKKIQGSAITYAILQLINYSSKHVQDNRNQGLKLNFSHRVDNPSHHNPRVQFWKKVSRFLWHIFTSIGHIQHLLHSCWTQNKGRLSIAIIG